jgi:hypothetical protein
VLCGEIHNLTHSHHVSGLKHPAGLRRAVLLPQGRVNPPIEFPPMADYTIEDALTHLAQHNAHHLGQIVTLRQAIGAWPPPEGSFTW